MDMFLVRRRLPAVPEAAVRAAAQRCRAHAEDLARTGHHIRYVGSAAGEDGFCGCLYEANSPEIVQLATERAAVPYEQIIRVVLPDHAGPAAVRPIGELYGPGGAA